jgi:hypothetical protein
MGSSRPRVGPDVRARPCPPVTFLDRKLPEWVDLRIVVIPPATEHAFKPACWRGRLIVVERGAIELEFVNGHCLPCEPGYVGILMGLSLRALCNRSDALTAVISGVSRNARA